MDTEELVDLVDSGYCMPTCIFAIEPECTCRCLTEYHAAARSEAERERILQRTLRPQRGRAEYPSDALKQVRVQGNSGYAASFRGCVVNPSPREWFRWVRLCDDVNLPAIRVDYELRVAHVVVRADRLTDGPHLRPLNQAVPMLARLCGLAQGDDMRDVIAEAGGTLDGTTWKITCDRSWGAVIGQHIFEMRAGNFDGANRTLQVASQTQAALR